MVQTTKPTPLPLKKLFQYTWPPLLASLGSIIIGITDSVIVSHYATSALAGVALGATYYELPVNILLGALMGYKILAPRVNTADGKTREIVGLCIMLRSLLPITALIVAIGIGAAIFGYFYTTDLILSNAFSYTAARLPSLLAVVTINAMSVTLIAWGHTRIPLLIFALSSPVNLALDILFVYGVPPMPELGALGAGLASTISIYLPIIFVLPLVLKYRSPEKPAQEISNTYAKWKALAWPSSLSAFVDYGGNIVFTGILALSGTEALAAMRLGAQIHILIFIVISSVSSAGLYLLGQTFKTHSQQIWLYRNSARRLFVVVGFGIGFILFVVGLTFAPFISPDANVVNAFIYALAIVCLLAPIAGLAYANITILRAFGLTNREFVSNAVSVWCAQIPVSLVIALFFNTAGVLPLTGLGVYWLIRCAITYRQVEKHIPQADKLVNPGD